MADGSLAGPTLSTASNPLEHAQPKSGVKSLDLDLGSAIERIREGGHKRIALQFPDEYLPHAPGIAETIRVALLPNDIRCFILADTTYGSCCVDEVAAEHVAADFLVHFGDACMSQTEKLPVAYIFQKASLDVSIVCKAIKGEIPHKSPLTVLAAPPYLEYLASIESGLATDYHIFMQTSKERPLVYIGSPPPSYLLALSSQSSSTYLYDPDKSTSSLITPRSLLSKRYALVQKAKVAGVFGILVGTLGVKGEIEILQHLMAQLKKKGKKGYVIAMGKVRGEKIGNFGEIECYCLVGCAYNSLLESRDFYRPVITPHELLLSLQRDAWSGDWITDFKTLMTMEASKDEDEDEPEFSLVTGSYISTSRPMHQAIGEDNGSQALSRKEQGQVAVVHGQLSPAAAFLQTKRAWKGLGSDFPAGHLENEDAAKLEEGRVGIARGYTVGQAADRH